MANESSGLNSKLLATLVINKEGYLNILFLKADAGCVAEIDGKVFSLSNDAEVAALIEQATTMLRTQLLEFLEAALPKEKVILSLGVGPIAADKYTTDILAGYNQQEIVSALKVLRTIKSGGNIVELASLVSAIRTEGGESGYQVLTPIPGIDIGAGYHTPIGHNATENNSDFSQQGQHNKTDNKKRHFDPS
jgi:hypothetical protein